MTVEESSLTRKQIREIFQRNKGAARALSFQLGCSHVSVSQVLRGKVTSQKILDAARERAMQLVEQEN